MSIGPDIASLIAQQQGGQQPQAQPQGASGVSGADALRQILDLASSLRQDPTFDDQDKLLLEQATTLIQRILADVQKGAHALLGGKMDTRAMARASGGSGY